MEEKRIRIILVDDDIRALKRMKALLVNFPNVEMVAEYTIPGNAIKFSEKETVDMAFLDIEMPGMSGLELAEKISRNSSKTKIVFTTSHEHYAIRALKQDAFDYLMKPIDIDELKKVFDKFHAKFLIKLSDRELEILGLIAQGLKSTDIAKKVFLSRHTVDTHRRKILQKTGVKNTAELIKYAMEHKLV